MMIYWCIKIENIDFKTQTSTIFSQLSHTIMRILSKYTQSNYQGDIMQTSRRTFIKWISVLGFLPFAGISLLAQPVHISYEALGDTHMDDFFDPDGWL